MASIIPMQGSLPNPSRCRKRGGFALIATLTIVSLVVLLMLGLVTLANQTRQIGNSNLRQAEAQANARLALALALGELQRCAGADQRVTASANIAATASGEILPSNAAPANNVTVNGVKKGLSPVKPGTRHWTGVWANADKPADSFTKTPSPTLVRWLVSGNENIPLGPLSIAPNSTLVSLTPGGKPGNPNTAALLVGPASVGDPATQLDNHVIAPLVGIKSNSTGRTNGRYAWWVGDEGVKAKFNLATEFSANTVASHPTLAVQRYGWEVVAGWQKYPVPGSTGAANLRKVVTRQTTALGDPDFAAVTTGASPVQRAYHALTTDSRGVLSDTWLGGLRIDLSAALSRDLPAARIAYDKSVQGNPSLPVKNTNIIPAIGGINYSPGEGPKWDRLRSLVADGTVAAGSGRLESRAPGDFSDTAMAPLISEFRLLLGMRLQPVGGAATQYHTWTCAKVAVVLANPYSYPLRWSRDLDIEVTIPHQSNPVSARDLPYPEYDYPARIWEQGGVTAPYFSNPSGNSSALFKNVRFRIAAGELPAGEARAYTIASRVERPVDDFGERIVPLTAWSASVLPDDMMVSLQMRKLEPLDYATTRACDVRESWTTTLLNLTLREGASSGTTGILRHISSFEIDNGPYGPTVRRIDAGLAERNTALHTKDWAIPLQLYSFQFSRPGEDYSQWLPYGDVGARSSTVRSYADFNARATRIRKTLMAYNAMPYFMELANSVAYLPFDQNNNSCGVAFTRNLWLSPLPWGCSANGPRKSILFHPIADPVSLAHFQHADLTADDIYGGIGHQPGHAFANAYAPMFVKRELTKQNRNDYRIDGGASRSTMTAYPRNYYDISHLLNTSVWDSCYLSTVPATGSTEPLNRRIIRRIPGDTSPELRDSALAAQRLLVDGGFNINSTEKDAWKALLAGTKHLKLAADGTAVVNEAIFPRGLGQSEAGTSAPTGTAADSFAGYRRLTDPQVDALATEIVRQVRIRGPFVSLGQFVNRVLVPMEKDRSTNIPEPARGEDLGRAGALQGAIDYCGWQAGGTTSVINTIPSGGKSKFSQLGVTGDRVSLQAEGGDRPRADLTGSRAADYGSSETWPWPMTSTDLNPGTVAGSPADKAMLLDPRYRAEQGFRSTGIPGWLTQADVLQAIGPVITARSDTFTVRAYGETLNPSTGKVSGKAWCEAVVQRVPEYTDPSNSPAQRDPVTPGQTKVLTPVNQRFGRQFQILSFRWLAPDEI